MQPYELHPYLAVLASSTFYDSSSSVLIYDQSALRVHRRDVLRMQLRTRSAVVWHVPKLRWSLKYHRLATLHAHVIESRTLRALC